MSDYRGWQGVIVESSYPYRTVSPNKKEEVLLYKICNMMNNREVRELEEKLNENI